MKKYLIAITLLVIIITLMAIVAHAMDAIVTFEPPATDTKNICAVADPYPDIAKRWKDGTLTELTGQCTTAAGQESVKITNIPVGVWYFAAFFVDTDGNRSDFSLETSAVAKADTPIIKTFPPIEVSTKTVTIQVEIR